MQRLRKIIFLFVCLFLLFLTCFASYAESYYRLTFLNVGKADAALLQLDDLTILVDTGSKLSSQTFLASLQRLGVTKLDAIFLSHTDKDHIGGLKKLLKQSFPIGTVYYGTLCSDEAEKDHPIRDGLNQYAFASKELSAGDLLTLSSTVSVSVLGPLSRDPLNENNNSLILLFRTPQGTALFTGDMDADEEKELLMNGCFSHADLLKVAHHGSKNSTSKAFALAVSPKAAVISTSSYSEPDTPDPKVISRLWDISSSVYLTQDDPIGVILEMHDGNIIQLSSSAL